MDDRHPGDERGRVGWQVHGGQHAGRKAVVAHEGDPLSSSRERRPRRRRRDASRRRFASRRSPRTGTVGATLIAWNYFGTCRGGRQAEPLPPHNDRGGDDGDALQGLCLSARSLVMATAPASPSSAPRVPPLRRNNDSHLFSIYIRYVPSIHCWLRLIVCVKRERVHFSAQPSPARGRRRSRRSSLRSPPKCLPLDRTSQG